MIQIDILNFAIVTTLCEVGFLRLQFFMLKYILINLPDAKIFRLDI